jgi:hypothetical protein
MRTSLVRSEIIYALKRSRSKPTRLLVLQLDPSIHVHSLLKITTPVHLDRQRLSLRQGKFSLKTV